MRRYSRLGTGTKATGREGPGDRIDTLVLVIIIFVMVTKVGQ